MLEILDPEQQAIEQLVGEFEANWTAESRKRIPGLLDGLPEHLAEEVAWEIVHVDLEFSLKAGLERRVEDYHEVLPRDDSPGSATRYSELVASEYSLRLREDATVDLSEYFARFPSPCDRLLNWHEVSPAASQFGLARFRAVAQGAYADHYEVVKSIGQGGLGRVWLVHDRRLGREVAIKEINAELVHDENCRQRFLREAEITARLNHPGVVPIHGLDEKGDGSPFYVMPYIDGETLQSAIRAFHNTEFACAADQNVALRRLLGHFLDVSQTADFAHKNGILHRDIKPANIMIGSFGETILVDWGLAKELPDETADQPDAPSGDGVADDEEDTLVVASSAETTVGSLVGSPGYMSPEQANGSHQTLDARSDVYSLGAVLYEILTNRPPNTLTPTGKVSTTRDSAATIQRAGARGATGRPLAAICQKALAALPAQRYQSAAALSADVERFLADEAVEAHRERLTERIARVGRNHRRTVGWLALVVIGIATLGISSSVVISRKNQQLSSALQQEADARERTSRVLEFFVDLFDSQDPYREGRDVMVSVAVGRARERITNELNEDPLQAAMLYQALADTSFAIGDHATALECAQQSVDIFARFPEMDRSEYRRALYTLASAHRMQDQPIPAVELLEQLLHSAIEGTEDPSEIARVKADLIHAYVMAARLEDACRLSEEVLTALDNVADENVRGRLIAHAGMAFFSNGDHDRAINVLRSGMGLDMAPSARSAILNNLAVALVAGGKASEAVEVLEGPVEDLLANLGDDHPATLKSRNALANAYLESGQVAAAEAVLLQTIPLGKDSLGETSQHQLKAMNNLAACRRLGGDLPGSLVILKECYDLRRSVSPKDDPFLLLVAHNLARTHAALGEVEMAVPMMEETLQLRREKLGAGHPNVFVSTSGMGAVYEAAGRHSDALNCYLEALDMGSTEPLRIDDLYRSTARVMLYQGEFQRAREMIEDWTVWRAEAGAPSENPIAALMLGEAHAGLQQWDEARALLEPMVEEAQGDSVEVIHAKSILGLVISKIGDRAVAERHLRDAVKAAESAGLAADRLADMERRLEAFLADEQPTVAAPSSDTTPPQPPGAEE